MVGAGACLLALTSTMRTPLAHADTQDVVSLIIGGSSIPVPPTDYIDDAFTKFLEPNVPGVGTTPPALGLFTPEGLYPIYSAPGPGGGLVKQLPFETSVYQGREILDQTILNDVNNLGEQVAVYGESQSATISGLSMTDLAGKVPTDSVHFVLVGDEETPFGGLLTRFAASDVPGLLRPELNVPSMGIQFYGPTPDDLFPTTIYTQQYDGFADFPRYPLDILSDLNAFLGIRFVHPTYRDLSTTAISEATKLPTTGDTMTTYYAIPMSMEAGLNSQYIPLMQPLAHIPVIGKPLADLLQPDVMALVNFGYGSPYWGFSVGGPDGGYANVTQPFGLFPSLQDFQQLPGALFTGTETGIENFIGDFTGTGPHPVALGSTALPDLAAMVSTMAPSQAPSMPDLAGLSPVSLLTGLQDGVNNVVNTSITATSTAYSTLLPTADLGLAGVATLPLYDFDLAVDGLIEALSGDPAGLVDAVGLPIAADTALLTLLGAYEITAVATQAGSIVADLAGLIP